MYTVHDRQAFAHTAFARFPLRRPSLALDRLRDVAVAPFAAELNHCHNAKSKWASIKQQAVAMEHQPRRDIDPIRQMRRR